MIDTLLCAIRLRPFALRLRPAALVMVAWLSATSARPAEAPRSHLVPAGSAAADAPTFASLGLSLTRASAVLRQQLALKRGGGLVVERIAAGSRAARVGFQQHDVLVRLDDQVLVLPEQFDALLEAAEPEAPLDCTVLRGGRELVIPLTNGLPPRGGPVAGGLRPTASSLAIVGEATPRQGPIEAARLRRLADETLVRQDPDCQIRLTSGDETRLVVSDPQGRVVFNGVIDTPEDRGRMPPAVRDRVGEMERLLGTRQIDPSAEERRGNPSEGSAPPAEVGRLDVAPVELR